MRRREFIRLLASILVSRPGIVSAEATGLPRIGTLDYGSAAARDHLWQAFYSRLNELGYARGKNIATETRWADGRAERLPPLAAELVASNVSLIVTAGAAAAQAAQNATGTIPIVTATGDLLGMKLVSSLARPAGNVTGVSTQTDELSLKRLELVRELIPTMVRLAIVSDAANPYLRAAGTRAVAEQSGLLVEIFDVSGPDEFTTAFSRIEGMRAQALILVPSPMFFGERHRLAELALKAGLPMVVGQREYAEAGGLLAYASNLAEGFRLAANYVDKILRGARPSDLPIEQPTKFELVVNLRTAKALGLTIPESFLLRADEVIE